MKYVFNVGDIVEMFGYTSGTEGLLLRVTEPVSTDRETLIVYADRVDGKPGNYNDVTPKYMMYAKHLRHVVDDEKEMVFDV